MTYTIRLKIAERVRHLVDSIGYARLASDRERMTYQRATRPRRPG